MVEQVIVTAIVGLLAAYLGALIALRFQSSYWKNILAGHEGWEHAQQGHHHSWEEKQARLIAEVEARLATQVQQLRKDWHKWEEKDAERIVEQIRQQEMSDEHARVERELARLPRVEETSMALDNQQAKHSQELPSTHRRPAMFLGANLASLDLSHRYLGRADMRNAQLSRTNFFMADLSGACLADADLSEADLSGANLTHADLRGAILTGANLLVTDMNDAILTGADLLDARNLTTQQIYTAIYDSTTQLDEKIDITLPRTSRIRNIAHDFPSPPPNTENPDQADATFSEEAEPFVEPMSEETMPALAVVKPEREPVRTPETAIPVPDTTDENIEPGQVLAPEPSLPVSDTTDENTELMQEDPASPPSPSPTLDDSSPSSQEINLLVDRQEGKRAKEPVKTRQNAKYHRRKRAKVG
ncbi:MAG: pentapeptide repeat-containing protein [Ktedonobacteraceae bacterium]